MRKFKLPLIIVAVIAVLALVKIFFLTPKKAETSGASGPNAAKPIALVTGYIIKPELLDNEVYASGAISANEEAALRPEVSGKIVYLNIVEGGRVAKGELLVKINDADLKAQLKKLQFQLSLAEEKEGRQKKLLDISGISKEEYDIVLNQRDVARAEIETLMAQIAKTEIRAPFSGILGIRKISEGAYVTPADILITMQQIDQVKVDFSVPEKYMNKVKKGDQILFTLEGTEGTFSANIYAIDPKIDLSTRTVQLRAIAPNRNGKIFPGSFAKIQLVLNKNNKAIMVPTQSIIPILKGQKVYLYKNGKVGEQMVETGVRTSAKIEIVKGLAVGDTVIVTGVMSIKNETPVKLIQLY